MRVKLTREYICERVYTTLVKRESLTYEVSVMTSLREEINAKALVIARSYEVVS